MKLRHVITSQQFTRSDLAELFTIARGMKRVAERGGSRELEKKIMISLFYEPSTRTRTSFEAAMHRLGGEVIGTENAGEFSSAAKGETLEDSIRVLAGYGDVIALRHTDEGAAARAAAIDEVPIINAGDGPGQHPTQALIDLYTIENELGRVDETTVALVGDLANGRAVRSLAYLLGKFQRVRLLLVAPKIVQMKGDILEYLGRHNVVFEKCYDLHEAARRADVVYQTRIQQERFGGNQAKLRKVRADCKRFVIDRSVVEVMQKHAIIMHPLPRVDEITREVDQDQRAVYFRQAWNGLPVRMALLSAILSRS